MSELKCSLCSNNTLLRNNMFCEQHSCVITNCGEQKINGYGYCIKCICNRNGCPYPKRSSDKYCIMYQPDNYLIGPLLRSVKPQTLYCGDHKCSTINTMFHCQPTTY